MKKCQALDGKVDQKDLDKLGKATNAQGDSRAAPPVILQAKATQTADANSAGLGDIRAKVERGNAQSQLTVLGGNTPASIFAGEWTNEDFKTRGETRINIHLDGSRIVVHMWGRCHPKECDWGERRLV